MIIALDGPAGAGKSTVAARLAARLGAAFLDTGAMYRAVTLVALERGVHPSDGQACGDVARGLVLSFDERGRILIDGRPGEPDIRSRTVTLNVSAVSAHLEVRDAIVARQRELAKELKNVVAEGRDTTTVVFPDADHKFFLDTSPVVRAQRRCAQEGVPDNYEQVLADIRRRDRLDTTRANSPLVQAPDATRIDVGWLTVDQVVERVLARVLGPADPPAQAT